MRGTNLDVLSSFDLVIASSIMQSSNENGSVSVDRNDHNGLYRVYQQPRLSSCGRMPSSGLIKKASSSHSSSAQLEDFWSCSTHTR